MRPVCADQDLVDPSPKLKLSAGKLSRFSIDSSGIPSGSLTGATLGCLAKDAERTLAFSRKAVTAKAITAASIDPIQIIGQNNDIAT